MENLTLSSLRQENTKENRNKMSAVNLAALTYLQGEQETAEFSSKAGQSDSDISFMNNVQERRKKGISGFFSNKFNWIKYNTAGVFSQKIEFDVNGTRFEGHARHSVYGGPVPIGKGLVINMQDTSLIGDDTSRGGAFMRGDSIEPQLIYYNDKTNVMSEIPLKVDKSVFRIRQNEIRLESHESIQIPTLKGNKAVIKADGVLVSEKGAKLINPVGETDSKQNQKETVEYETAQIGENGLEVSKALDSAENEKNNIINKKSENKSDSSEAEYTEDDLKMLEEDEEQQKPVSSYNLLSKKKNISSVENVKPKKAKEESKEESTEKTQEAATEEKKAETQGESTEEKKAAETKEKSTEEKEEEKDWKSIVLEKFTKPGDFFETITKLADNVSEKTKLVVEIATNMESLKEYANVIVANDGKSTGYIDKMDIVNEEVKKAISQYNEIVEYIDNIISFGQYLKGLLGGSTSGEYAQKGKLTWAVLYKLFSGQDVNDNKGIYEFAGIEYGGEQKKVKEDKLWNPVGAKIIILPGLVGFISLKPDFDFNLSNKYSFDVNLSKSNSELMADALEAWDSVGNIPSRIYDVLKTTLTSVKIVAKDKVSAKGSLSADLVAGIKMGVGMLFEGEAAIHALLKLAGAMDDDTFFSLEGSHEIDLSQFPNPVKMMSHGATQLKLDAALGINAGIKTVGSIKSELFGVNKQLWDYTAFSWDLAKLNFGGTIKKNANDSILDSRIMSKAFSAEVLHNQIKDATTEENQYGFKISPANADIQKAISNSEEVQEKSDSEEIKKQLASALNENATEEDIQKALEQYHKLILEQNDALLLLERLKNYAQKDPAYVDNMLEADIGISRHEDVLQRMEEVKSKMSEKELTEKGELEYYKIRMNGGYFHDRAATRGYKKKRNDEIESEARRRVITKKALIELEEEKMRRANESEKNIINSLETYITSNKIKNRDVENQGFIDYYKQIRGKETNFFMNIFNSVTGKSKNEMFGLRHNMSEMASLEELKTFETEKRKDALDKHVEKYAQRITDLKDKLKECGIDENYDKPNAKFQEYYETKYGKDYLSSFSEFDPSAYTLDNVIDYQKQTFMNDRYSGKNFRIMEELQKIKDQMDSEKDEKRKKQLLVKAKFVFLGPDGYSLRELENQAFRVATIQDIIDFEAQRVDNINNMDIKNMTDLGVSGKNVLDDVIYNIQGVKKGAKNLFGNIKDAWTMKHLNPMRLKLYELSGLNVELIKKGGKEANAEIEHFDPSKVFPLLQKEIENGNINPEEIFKRVDLVGGVLDFAITNQKRIEDIKANVSVEYLIEYERSKVKKYTNIYESSKHYKHENRLNYLLQQQKAIDAVRSVKEKQEITKKVRDFYFSGKLDYMLDKKRLLTDDEKAMKPQLDDKTGFLNEAKKGFIIGEDGKKYYDPGILMAMLNSIAGDATSEYEERLDKLKDLQKNNISDTHAYDAYLNMGGGRAFRQYFNKKMADSKFADMKIDQMIRFAKEQLRISSRNETMQKKDTTHMNRYAKLGDKVNTIFGSIKSTAKRWGSRISDYFNRKFKPMSNDVISGQESYQNFRGGDYEQFQALLDLKEAVSSGKIESASPDKVQAILSKYNSSIMKGDGFKEFLRKRVIANVVTPKTIMDYVKSKKDELPDEVKAADKALEILNGGSDPENKLSETEIRTAYRKEYMSREKAKHNFIVNAYKTVRGTMTTDADRHFRERNNKGYTPNVIINYQKTILQQVNKKYVDRIEALKSANSDEEAVKEYIRKNGDKGILKKLNHEYELSKLSIQSSAYHGGFKSGFASAMEFEKSRLEFYQKKKQLALLPQNKINKQSSILRISIKKNEETKNKLQNLLARMRGAKKTKTA